LGILGHFFSYYGCDGDIVVFLAEECSAASRHECNYATGAEGAFSVLCEKAWGLTFQAFLIALSRLFETENVTF
jgi:hypothetical protein